MSSSTPTPTSTGYKQGHSQSTLSTHLLRTAESDAAFLLPHLIPNSQILDLGCGPGTITVGLARYAPVGRVVGVDLSASVLERARKLAADAGVSPTSSAFPKGLGAVTFELADVLDRLPFPDASFDVVFASQVFGHFVPPDQPLRALAEVRRVLKSGGLLATRDAVGQNFFPKSSGLDRLWVGNFQRVVLGGEGETSAAMMPALLRKAGFAVEDPDKVRIGASAGVYSTPEARRWLAERGAGQLKEGEPFYRSWVEAGIAEEEIRETVRAAKNWAETEDAWFVTTQCEVLAWK